MCVLRMVQMCSFGDLSCVLAGFFPLDSSRLDSFTWTWGSGLVPFPLSLALHSTLYSCFSTSSPFLFLWLHFSALPCVLWKSLFVALCSGFRTTRPILGMATRACCMEPPWRPGAVQLRRECTCSSGPLSCCRWLHGQGHIPPDLCPGSSSAG